MTSNEVRDALDVLRALCQVVCAPETAYDPGTYVTGTLTGHCALVAHEVQVRYGGHLLSGRVEGQPHIWNQLADGQEVDLTSGQFGGDGYHPLVPGRRLRPRQSISTRQRLFSQRLLGHSEQDR